MLKITYEDGSIFDGPYELLDRSKSMHLAHLDELTFPIPPHRRVVWRKRRQMKAGSSEVREMELLAFEPTMGDRYLDTFGFLLEGDVVTEFLGYREDVPEYAAPELTEAERGS